MGGAGFQNQVRQLGGNVSFAQSLSGSQPATPLDLSYVPATSLHVAFTSPCDVCHFISTNLQMRLVFYFHVTICYLLLFLLELWRAASPTRQSRLCPCAPHSQISIMLLLSRGKFGHLMSTGFPVLHHLFFFSFFTFFFFFLSPYMIGSHRMVFGRTTTCANLVSREFPSLSNNSQLNSANSGSMWASAGSRNIGGPVQRTQGTPISSQQGAQEDMFGGGSSRMANNQGSLRFGNEGNLLTASQGQPSTADEFPPLNRGSNGEVGSDRNQNLMSLGYASQHGASGLHRGNGLLNALSANSRANDARSPPGIGAPRLFSQPDSKRSMWLT